MALVKYNNNSISSITAASSLPTGAMVLIKEQTASSSSTISFVDGTSDVVLDSTYPIYKFVWINVHPATDNVRFSFQGNAAGDGDVVAVTAATEAITVVDDVNIGSYLDFHCAVDAVWVVSGELVVDAVGSVPTLA